MQALYITYNPDGDKFKLPYCIITFGFVQFLMSQLPDLHSLRFLNALSNFCTLTFSAIAVGMSIHTGATYSYPCMQQNCINHDCQVPLSCAVLVPSLMHFDPIVDVCEEMLMHITNE